MKCGGKVTISLRENIATIAFEDKFVSFRWIADCNVTTSAIFAVRASFLIVLLKKLTSSLIKYQLETTDLKIIEYSSGEVEWVAHELRLLETDTFHMTAAPCIRRFEIKLLRCS